MPTWPKRRSRVKKPVHQIDTPSGKNRSWNFRGVKKVAPQGKAWVLTSASPLDENSFAAANRVAPRAETIRLTASNFQRTLPAHSVTILRLKATR
jgi:alpha-L-arabinofuranosidase